MIHVDDFGRSDKISEDIIKKIKKGKISQVSVMLGFVDNKILLQLKKTKVSIRLHLNLTEQVEKFSKDISSMSFLGLMFANKKKKLFVTTEIDRQINEFMEIYNLKKIKVDGHQHVHFIPWIYKYLCTKHSHNIYEMRYPVEPMHFISLKHTLSLQFLRNLIAVFILKIFSIFNEKRTNQKFFGVLYTNMYDKNVLNLQKKKFSSFVDKEILLHIGIAEKSEKNLFTRKQFIYNSSRQRKIESDLL